MSEQSIKKDLRIEIFSSKEAVKPVKLHVYELHSNKIENTFQIIRGACWKIKNYYKCGAFEDGRFIYTTEKIEENNSRFDFELAYMGEQRLEVLENRNVYEKLIKYLIEQKLRTVSIWEKYRKYSCGNEITSKWILTTGGFSILTSKNKELYLQRKYDFKVKIKDDGKAYLDINTKATFESKSTIYDEIQRGNDPVGMEVKNTWGWNKQTGILEEVCDYTVVDPLEFGSSLKKYYEDKKEGYRVANLPDDTKVVKVNLGEGKSYQYYPQALKPVLTREIIGSRDPDFSMQVEKFVKRNMAARMELDKDFIKDIGKLETIGNLEFEDQTCPVEELGFHKGKLELPDLLCENQKVIKAGKDMSVFRYGFYKKPEKAIKIGYIYPEGKYEYVKAVANAIYLFAQKGIFQGEKDRYTKEKLLDIQVGAMIKEEYRLGDMTDYKRAAMKLKKIEGIDMVIAVVPDGKDSDNPYNPFKKVWAEANIPSQMIRMRTAELFFRGKAAGNATKFYLHNIVLGILGKTGGIPWILKEMPGDVDCFVGMDVGTTEKSIHYPACSVVFDKYGKLLGYYKPKQAQRGEKIKTEILQDIFDRVLLAYEEDHGEYPKHIVIHRDGFSNENDEWYEQYFKPKGIEYTIVEIRKNIGKKLLMLEDKTVKNPGKGYCIYNGRKAYLVTTEIDEKKGSPNPLLIEKKCGNISMAKILYQIFYLAQLHVGSTKKMRLPITTGYADKICKNKDFVPEGEMDHKLFFL